MPRECALCGKKPVMVMRRVKLRGKYNPTGKRQQAPNLQKMRLPSGKRASVCTNCMKAQAKA